MIPFGNFKGLPVGLQRVALIPNEKGVDYLRIEGTVFTFCDASDIVDTPRLPTKDWIEWGIKRATEIANSLSGPDTKNIPAVDLVLRVELDYSSTDLHIKISDNQRKEPFREQIADFILSFTYVGALEMKKRQIFEHFQKQQPQ